VGLHVVSDLLIALAYFPIPLTLIYFIRTEGSAAGSAVRSVSSVISGGTPIRTGKPNVPSPRFT